MQVADEQCHHVNICCTLCNTCKAIGLPVQVRILVIYPGAARMTANDEALLQLRQCCPLTGWPAQLPACPSALALLRITRLARNIASGQK